MRGLYFENVHKTNCCHSFVHHFRKTVSQLGVTTIRTTTDRLQLLRAIMQKGEQTTIITSTSGCNGFRRTSWPTVSLDWFGKLICRVRVRVLIEFGKRIQTMTYTTQSHHWTTDFHFKKQEDTQKAGYNWEDTMCGRKGLTLLSLQANTRTCHSNPAEASKQLKHIFQEKEIRTTCQRKNRGHTLLVGSTNLCSVSGWGDRLNVLVRSKLNNGSYVNKYYGVHHLWWRRETEDVRLRSEKL